MGAHIQAQTDLPGKPLIITLEKMQQTDRALVIIQELSQYHDIRALYLDFSSVSEEGFQIIATLITLEILGLRHVELKDSDLLQISLLSRLNTLHLDETQVSNAGLQHLSGLKTLERITLSKTPIKDDAIDVIAKMPRLKQLVIHRTGITDVGIEKLNGLERLEELAMENVKLTNRGGANLGNDVKSR